jgi:hypothetical protein
VPCYLFVEHASELSVSQNEQLWGFVHAFSLPPETEEVEGGHRVIAALALAHAGRSRGRGRCRCALRPSSLWTTRVEFVCCVSAGRAATARCGREGG